MHASDDRSVRELDRGEAELVAAWRDAKALARKHGDEETELRARVLDMLRDDAGNLPGQVYADGRLILQVKVVHSSRTDTAALREQYPGIAAQFAADSTSVRMSAP